MSLKRIKIWIQTLRPKTLGASLAPIIILAGVLLGEDLMDIQKFILVMLIAITAQISSNVANDYFDYLSGADDRRKLGPKRMITTGEITPGWMLLSAILWTLLCAVLGIYLIVISSKILLLIGLLVIAGIIIYSSGPYPLSYNGLGDIAVVLFYGLIPVPAGYYAVTGSLSLSLIPAAFSVGFSSCNILVVNNYRDYFEDKVNNKNTLVVKMGKRSGPYLYVLNSILACIAFIVSTFIQGSYWTMVIGLVILSFFYLIGSYTMFTRKGRGINPILGYSSFISLILSVLLFIAFL